MELLNNIMPLIVFVGIFLICYFIALPKWKKSWDQEKKDIAKKIASELKKSK